MSFVYEVMREIYALQEEDRMEVMRDLYEQCFNEEGDLRSTWKRAYGDWLSYLADNNDIPEGIFRDCWIRDALGEAFDGGDLDFLKKWFGPSDSDQESEEKENPDSE